MYVCVHSCGHVHVYVCGRGCGGKGWENLSLNRSHVKRQTCWPLQADLSFPESVRDRCYAGFEVGPTSLARPVGNAWQLSVSLQSAFKIALSVSGSRAQLPRTAWWVSGQQ